MDLYYRIPRTGRHVLFWILYFTVQAAVMMQFFETEEVFRSIDGRETVIRTGFPGSFGAALKAEFMSAPGKMAAIYFNLYFLIPTFLFNKKMLRYALFLAVAILLSAGMQALLSKYVLWPMIYPDLPGPRPLAFSYWVQYTALAFNVVVFTGSIKILGHYYRQKNTATELARQQLDTELDLLRAQINPHFFFNTLNNLYGLALENSKETPEMILRLSEIMSYILYDSKTQQIPLKTEMEILEKYISLEKLRFDDNLKIRFSIDGPDTGVEVPPLLFLPLVENAFKHGPRQSADRPWVAVDLEIKDFIRFSVKNSLGPDDDGGGGNEKEEERRSGLGLTNLKRRLELLYPGKHRFSAGRRGDYFQTVIEIPLTDELPDHRG